jgi:enoyl-CoA hydratase/carnithine racemase
MSIEIERHGAVWVVTIARPEVMNCLDAAANLELGEVWTEFSESSDVQIAVLTGKGDRSFSAGADLKSLIPAQRSAVTGGKAATWGFGGGLARGRVMNKPIIAAVNGHCLAGGLEMALACDIRIASHNARFGLAEVKWAIIPGAGGTQRLPRAVPLGMALEMILTGDPIDADEALRVGLINRIVPQAELVAAALELASRIASRGPVAVRAARRAVYEGLGRDFEAGMAIEEFLFNESIRTEDASEGPRAFAEKRTPIFKGC